MTIKIGTEFREKGKNGAFGVYGDAAIYSDEGDNSDLVVFGMGNQDWYIGIRDTEHPRIFPIIRCCTSGTAQPRWWGFLVSGIWHAIKGKKKDARDLFKLAAEYVMKDD